MHEPDRARGTGPRLSGSLWHQRSPSRSVRSQPVSPFLQRELLQ
jgi:hypothetical protein